jgi:inactive STAND
MPSLKRLKAKYEDLEEEYDQVREKLKFLKKERIIKTDSEAKYELEQRIEKYEAKLEEIEEELDELEEQINQPQRGENSDLEKSPTFDFLYKSLLKLGYWEQHNLFEEIAGKYSHGVFLIQGCSKDYGQRWLLNRLALIIPNILEGKKIFIDLNRTSSRTDILAIWNEFAGWVTLPEKSSPSQITEKICELWKSQNVLIVFNNADETIKENLCDLLNEFWASLTQKVLEDNNQQNAFKLLIFLIDYQGVISQWNVGFVEKYDSDWQPNYPLGLPAIHPFSDKDLRDWLNFQSDFLPPAISANKTETVRVLLEKQGVPMPTLRKICDLCGCNWFEQENKWLRF